MAKHDLRALSCPAIAILLPSTARLASVFASQSRFCPPPYLGPRPATLSPGGGRCKVLRFSPFLSNCPYSSGHSAVAHVSPRRDPQCPSASWLGPFLRRAWCMYVYALVCLCGHTRVPPAMPSAQIPGQGVLTAVPVGSRPSLCPFCVHLPQFHFEIRTSFWPSKSLASVLLSRPLHLTCNHVQNSCFCPFCVHLPHAFSFYNIYVMGVALGLRQVYTKWAIRRRPRCPPGVP